MMKNLQNKEIEMTLVCNKSFLWTDDEDIKLNQGIIDSF